MKKKPLGCPNATYIGKDKTGTEWWEYRGDKEAQKTMRSLLRKINQTKK